MARYYTFGIQGPRNVTATGHMYSTVREALNNLDAVQAYRGARRRARVTHICAYGRNHRKLWSAPLEDYTQPN